MTEEPKGGPEQRPTYTPLVPRPVVGLIAVLLTLGLLGYVFTSVLQDKEVDWRVTFGLMGMILFTLGADPKTWPWGGGR